ncbi:MAG: recombinase family protein, partial [Oscillospiraceae bacterium]|nr:recombinase family protein [Oscillospiraceae bacterium]
IITPEKIYDLNNDLDDTYADFKGLFARQEYKMITKRLRQGKKVGSRRGDWTNGVPPFPYVYERYGEEYNPKGLVVNTDESSLYREIIESALNKLSPNKIAITLNQRGALTRKGNFWSGAIIQRLLLDETHLGKIISNKSQGNGHKNRNPNSKKLKMNPREEWVIVENCHEPVKTQEEHDKLAHMIKTRNLAPNRSMSQTYTLSGIVKCGKCGRFMTFGKDKRNKGRIIMKSCVRQDPLGNKCRNSGMWLDGFEELLLKEIRNFKDNFAIQEAEVSAVNTNLITNLIKEKETQSAKFKKALDVVNDGYELGDYSRDVWMDRKKKWTDKIRETENEIYELKKQLNDVPEISSELRRQNIEDFFKRIESPTSLISNAEKNDMYKSIIDHVVWIKSDGTVQIDIKYR